jgi:hypothetical protein
MSVVIGSQQDVATLVRDLALKHHVSYKETASDVLAGHITRLSDDDVELDKTQLLLLALRRAGYVSSSQALQLLGAYLHRDNR